MRFFAQHKKLLLPHPLPHSGSILHMSLQARPFTKSLSWRLILHSCSASLQNLVGNSGETQCLKEAEQQAEAHVDVPYTPFQIVNSVSFVSFLSFSILSLLPFSILSLLPLHHPFFLFCSILCPSKKKTSSFITFSFHQWHILHTMTFKKIIMYYSISQILMLELQLVIPRGLEETRVGSIKGGISGPPLQIVVLSLSVLSIILSAPFLSSSSSPFPHFP